MIQRVVTWGYFVWSFHRMFAFDMVPSSHGRRLINVSLRLTKADCDAISSWAVPVATLVCMALVLREGIPAARRKNSLAFHTLVCAVVIGVTAMPMYSLTRPPISLWGSNRYLAPAWHTVQPYRLSNACGLFRRMTGVGGPSHTNVGWAGLPPSIVARPEIVLEGIFDGDNNDTWTEINFRWKPGNVHERPLLVAPHQPRYVHTYLLSTMNEM